MLGLKKQSKVEYIVVGLGNPGTRYEGTRHNVGFDALDACARAWNIEVTRARFDALTGFGVAADRQVLLMKPQTFMNASGTAVQKAAAYYGIEPQNVLVLFDDISLEPGRLRMRQSGSAGGHNGLKSIIALMGQAFLRIKIGVGAKPHPDYDLADWVLSRLTPEQAAPIYARFDDVVCAAELAMQGQVALAQSRCGQGAARGR